MTITKHSPLTDVMDEEILASTSTVHATSSTNTTSTTARVWISNIFGNEAPGLMHFAGEFDTTPDGDDFCPPEFVVDVVDLDGKQTLLSGYVCPNGWEQTNPRHEKIIEGHLAYEALCRVTEESELLVDGSMSIEDVVRALVDTILPRVVEA